MIVFFGSGPVAADSLRLLEKHFEIEAIITKPTTVHEMKVTISQPPIFGVSTKSELDELILEKNFDSQVAILIDFGIIVSKKVIQKFEFGIVNSHFSLLPEWRGADPITFSILSGQEKTGVSLMLIDEGMDTGKLIAQKTLKLDLKVNNSELTKQLINLSAEMLSMHIPKYLNNETKPRSQPHPDRATYSRKLVKSDGILDFSKPATVLEREIRAYSSWPKSRTQIAGKDVVILDATASDIINPNGNTGSITVTSEKKLSIKTAEGSLIIETLKPAGKNVMGSGAFIAGYGSKL
ncbi:methionyl-tRNA formyltransferase [Candidatus Nomurabacteria bacterium]|nr:methionyl-tRNA formyltransferase [Candidatus Nomurabacteria bacterium]